MDAPCFRGMENVEQWGRWKTDGKLHLEIKLRQTQLTDDLGDGQDLLRRLGSYIRTKILNLKKKCNCHHCFQNLTFHGCLKDLSFHHAVNRIHCGVKSKVFNQN